LSIGTNNGPVPLTELGNFKLAYNPTTISREGGNRTISVSAGVQKGFNIPEKNKELVDYVSKMNLPEEYTWQTGGANEENNKSVQSILKAMVVAGLLILITMVIEFGSYRQAAIALMIIPVSIAGVFYIFALAQIPLSFPALIGVLALFGIVVTHAIVVIEKINDNRKEGIGLIDSIVDAAENRLEPVMLTSLATILGLIPITLADPLWRGLGGAIIAGLIFSGALKLFFVPVMYYNWFKDEEAGSFTDI
jgi:multidrug efflux pump subunit AcrB